MSLSLYMFDDKKELPENDQFNFIKKNGRLKKNSNCWR